MKVVKSHFEMCFGIKYNTHVLRKLLHQSLVVDKKKKIKKKHNIFMFKDSSLQENLLFQNSKSFWELFFLSFSEKKPENTK